MVIIGVISALSRVILIIASLAKSHEPLSRPKP